MKLRLAPRARCGAAGSYQTPREVKGLDEGVRVRIALALQTALFSKNICEICDSCKVLLSLPAQQHLEDDPREPRRA